MILFLCLLTPAPPTVNAGEYGLRFFFPFSLMEYPWVTVGEFSFSPPKFSENLSDCLRILGLVLLVSVSLESSVLTSDQLSCSEVFGDLDLVRLEVFFTAFEKINSGFGFGVRNFPMACGLDIRYFI